MDRSFKFLLFILAIQRHVSVNCYAPGSLIWSRNLQKFIPIANIPTFGAYEQEIVAKSREKEKHNFQGKVLTLGYVKDYNMVDFIDNDTKVTGVCGEIWNVLAEYSNFTLKTIKVDKVVRKQKGRRVSVFSLIEQNKAQIVPRMAFSSNSRLMDYTTPIWETRYRIYIQPELVSDTNWIFNMFDYKVWFAILFFYLLLSVLGYLLQNISIRVSGDEKSRYYLQDHLFYTFATLCSQGFIPDSLDRRSKIFGVSKRIFAWLLLIVLSSHVISHMTNLRMHLPFEDIESLLIKTNRSINMYSNSIIVDNNMMMALNLSQNVREGRRVFFSTSQGSMHRLVCEPKQITQALLELEDTKQAFGNRYCELVAVGKSYFPTWVTFGVTKGFKYKRTFDIGILKMREFGLIDGLKKRWMKTPSETVDSGNGGHAPFTPVTFDQVLMLFVILGIGIVASAIIFVLEVIVFVYKSNQRRPVREKGLIGKAGLNAHRLPAVNYQNNRIRPEIQLSDGSRMPIYVQNVFVVDPKRSLAQNNECPRNTFYN